MRLTTLILCFTTGMLCGAWANTSYYKVVEDYAALQQPAADFPYQQLAGEIKALEPMEANRLFVAMDSLQLQPGGILFTCLTEENAFLKDTLLNHNELSGWNFLIRWSERYQNFSQHTDNDPALFMAVGDYWLSMVAGAIEDSLESNKDLSHDFEYQFLIKRLDENSYTVTRPTPSLVEKGLYNINRGRFGYVLSRFWLESPWFIKLGLLLGIVIVLAGIAKIFSIFKNLIKR